MAPAWLALLAALPLAAALNGTVVDGVLSVQGRPPITVGAYTSALNAAVAAAFAGAPATPASAQVLVNSTSGALSFLTLTGAYQVDEPLLLLPQFVLVLQQASLTAAANLSAGGAALVLANHTSFSAVVSPSGPAGALLTCPPGGPSPPGVQAVQAPNFLADGLTVTGCGLSGGTAGIHVKGAPYFLNAEVAHCVVTHCSRAIWTETVASVFIHGNTVLNNSAHAIDFDAYSSNSTAYNNSCAFNAEEGIFVEQGATRIVVAGNTLGPGNAVGVAVYNNDGGAVTGGHVITGNTIFGNHGAGISAGSTGPREGAPTAGVHIFGNVLRDNGEGAYGARVDVRLNGGVHGVLIAGNSGGATLAADAVAPNYVGNVTAFDPLDRLPLAAAGVAANGD